MTQTNNFVFPPIDGSVFFPQLCDFHLEHNPTHRYAVLVPPHGEGQTIDLTYAELAHAVHRTAGLVNPITDGVSKLGHGRVVAIVAATDTILYQTLLLAIARSGNIPFPISPRNTSTAVVHLIEKTDCHHIVYGENPGVRDLVKDTRQTLETKSYNMHWIPLPALPSVFPDLGKAGTSSFTPYPYNLQIERDSVAAIMHSSGSTGLPKPVFWSHAFTVHVFNLPSVTEMPPCRVYGCTALPPFHAMGWASQIAMAMTRGLTIALWAPSDPLPTPNSDNVLAAYKAAQCTMCISVPSFLVTWSKDNDALKFLSSMEFILFGGGPLPQHVGDQLIKDSLNIINSVGATEFCAITLVNSTHPDRAREDWLWVQFTDRVAKRWVPIEGDESGAMELQLLDSDLFVPAAHNTDTPDGPAYASSDLYIEHPTKKGLWKVVGRLDDQLTLATGEKINPGPIEDLVTQNSLVQGAVLIGRERNQVAVLIEPVTNHAFDSNDPAALAAFRNEIWPSIEAANRTSATFARIFKELILVTSPSKPLQRTPKNTIVYKAALSAYADEIDNLYTEVERARQGDVPPPPSWSEENVREWLSDTVKDVLDHHVDDEKDLFDHGADSLTATYIRNRIMGAMNNASDPRVKECSQYIDQNIVFVNPSIRSLAARITQLSRDPHSASDKNDGKDTVETMRALVECYSASIPDVREPSTPSRSPTDTPSRETVLLTGSTGALGTFLLAGLLEDERVERIWALNRRSKDGVSLEKRQSASYVDKDLSIDILNANVESGRLTLVEAQLDSEDLGLDTNLFAEICTTTTVVIHNAWRLDFNLALASFESHIKGTRNLMDVVLRSPQPTNTKFLFTSSIGTLASWLDKSIPVPEDPVNDRMISVGTGYSEGKWVGEKLVEELYHKSGIPTTNIRLGQLSGSTNGMWSISDWFPILVTSSIHLESLPDALGSVSWIPLHHAATAILEIALNRSTPPSQVLHLSHPRPTPWTTILTSVSTALEPIIHSRLPLVPFPEWLEKLEHAAKTTEANANRIPAIKLHSFFRDMAQGDVAMRAEEGLDKAALTEREAGGQVRMKMDKTRELSIASGEVPALGEEDVARWVGYWAREGLFERI